MAEAPDPRSYEAQLKEAKEVMCKLPSYIVDSFIEAGYDTVETICDMDDSAISMIEEYITTEYCSDPRFTRGITTSGSFKFPPGHKKLIQRFLSEQKAIYSQALIKQRKRCSSESACMPPKKKVPAKNDVTPRPTVEDAASIYKQVHSQILSWQRSQKNEEVKELKEHDGFELNVNWNDDTQGHIVSITCTKCGKPYKLGLKEGRNSISNWTKHLSKCIKKAKAPCTPSVQMYFQNTSTTKVNEDKQHFRHRPSINTGGADSHYSSSVPTFELATSLDGSSLPFDDSPLPLDSNSLPLDSSPLPLDDSSFSINSAMIVGQQDTCTMSLCESSSKLALQHSDNAISKGQTHSHLDSSVDDSQLTLHSAPIEDTCTALLSLGESSSKLALQHSDNAISKGQTHSHLDSSVDDSQLTLHSAPIEDTCTALLSLGESSSKLHLSDKGINKSQQHSHSMNLRSLSSPPINDKHTSQTNWTRTFRKHIALLKAGDDIKQTKITSFFDRVMGFIEHTPEVGRRFLQGRNSGEVELVSPLLQRLFKNARSNAQRLPAGRRHEEVLKKFATSLLIYSGSMTYEYIYKNLPDALPSLRTVQRLVESAYKPITEGEFRFDDLVTHLNTYKSPKIVAIGEDATRVISRVEYDKETDRLIGFVLPCNDAGLPLADSFLAVSFEAIEEHFRSGTISKYAFLYMAQPISDGVPAFCLCCIGTDNKFCNKLVLKRWKYIHFECQKRGIKVVSFGADGDSRELKAMQTSMQICISTKPRIDDNSLCLNLQKLAIPSEWKSWFAVGQATSVSYIQDPVHVAVKLKARLMKPSIILPMGRYLAGAHHLRFVQHFFGKDEHGLRERDLNHKDRQNYEAVLRICSTSVDMLLNKFPDAKATMAYLEVIRCISAAFLDKKLTIINRITKAWFAVFFLRYWRRWLLLNDSYTLGNHFVTLNAYMCVEINAHSLITYAITLKELRIQFCPWLLGSQSCERMFRAVRSMTPTFSTMINFAMYGLLRRMHRMAIQFKLEGEAQTTGISYPRVDRLKKRAGSGSKEDSSFSTDNNSILEAVEEGKKSTVGNCRFRNG